MRGRRPAGPEVVDRLEGSQVAKERLKVVLETLSGQCRVTEACERLGICEQRFHQLREQMLESALEGLEPRSAGRPARVISPEAEKVQTLEQEIFQLQIDKIAAKAREEIHLILPRTAQEPTEPEKKTKPRQRSRRGKKRST